MDLKTNTLQSKIETEDVLFPELNGLKFGHVTPERMVFDATSHCEANEIADFNHKLFMRNNMYYIKMIADTEGISTSEMFYENGDGHILIASELVIVYLMYVDKEMFYYFCGLISDLMTDGVAYSDSYIFEHTRKRLPSFVLEQIIKERNTDETGQEQ